MGSKRNINKKKPKSDRTNFAGYKLFQKLYGVGKTEALRLCAAFGVRPMCPQDVLPPRYIESLRHAIGAIYEEVWGDTATSKDKAILKKISLKTYAGTRHEAGLPVRGQGTHTNAKTRRKRRVS